jgi:hypothetical protein
MEGPVESGIFMSIQIETEQVAIEEAAGILLERMPPSKVARLLSAWQVGRGDYPALRDKLFAGETVDSLYEKAKPADGK